VKGDKVEIVIDTGGATKTYEVAATRAGRRVEVVNRRGLVEVALVEHPADQRARAGAGKASPPQERAE
jgi:hypothetical protein